ncbi:hypothetical protein L484_024483 [Morus notabilis]|uniref:ZF-HD dimerization-type domain-containing protein n=1 Tax=Morus notabilis TaxID=981085 RepID=W9RT41_9ROSA|nr:zinc-finger homeodomain protein 2 [Morus notabilis]EXB93145.1 hypothetical protein L484_024483 [Morus notabilis]
MATDHHSKVLSKESETKPSKITVNYKECRRNHAVSIGSHAVDGCREFSPAGDQGTQQGFLCEACGCHRSFHRKEMIRNGVVHRAPTPAPQLMLPPAFAVLPTGGYPTLPFVVLHPVDYNSLSQQPPGQSHHDHDQYHPLQNERLDGCDLIRSGQKPKSIKRPKTEPF